VTESFETDFIFHLPFSIFHYASVHLHGFYWRDLRADRTLYEGLLQGGFCSALTSRQMGKSSLMVRTAARLREDGVGVAVLDLTAIGQNLTAEQWYDGLLVSIGRQLRLEDEVEEFWLN
jgi:hypothetical protein